MNTGDNGIERNAGKRDFPGEKWNVSVVDYEATVFYAFTEEPFFVPRLSEGPFLVLRGARST